MGASDADLHQRSFFPRRARFHTVIGGGIVRAGMVLELLQCIPGSHLTVMGRYVQQACTSDPSFPHARFDTVGGGGIALAGMVLESLQRIPGRVAPAASQLAVR